MPYNRWIGGCGGTAERAQVSTLTFGGTWEANDNVAVTLTAEDGTSTQVVTTVAGDTTIANIIATVVTDLNNAADRTNANFNGLFEGISFVAASGTTITATSLVAGKPFSLSVTTTENGGGAADAQTLSAAVTTTNIGKLDWNTASNHMTSAVPTTGDFYHLDAAAKNGIRHGLNQSAVTLANLTQSEGFRHYVGWWTHIAGLAVNHFALKIGATVCNIGEKCAGGSNVNPSLLLLNFGTAQTTVNLKGTAHTSSVSGLPPVMLAGTHASNKCTATGFCYFGWGVATPGADFKLAEFINDCAGGIAILGAGATQLTNVRQRGQQSHTIVNTAITGDGTSGNYGLSVAAGYFTANGTGLIAFAKFTGGYSWLNNARGGAIVTDYYQSGTATVDFTQDARTGSITNVRHFDGSQGAAARAVSATQIAASGIPFDAEGKAGGGYPSTPD
jgi:hypothetical protein